MKNLINSIFMISILSGCAVGHGPWVDYRNDQIGTKAFLLDPSRYGDAGEIIRGDFLISGKGFTHITKDESGNIIQHWDISEVLPIYANRDSWAAGSKDLVGKCLIYYVVDPETHIIKSWGFDQGANPLSCQIWQ